MKEQPREPNVTNPKAPQTQFTLAHLLLWSFATCVVLAYEQWRLKWAAADESFRWYFNSRLLFYAPLNGACLAALFLCFCRKVMTGSRFPSEPGHWLLIVSGVSNVCGTAQSIANYFIGEEWLNVFPDWLSATYGTIVPIISAAVALIAARVFRKELLWGLTFVVVALGSLDSVLYLVLLVIFKGKHWFLDEFFWGLGSRIVFSLPAIVAICAILFERPRRRHDFLHWVGIAVLLLRIVAEWPSWIVWLRMFR